MLQIWNFWETGQYNRRRVDGKVEYLRRHERKKGDIASLGDEKG